MRAGGCTVQQALTPEAASVVKQAVSLARRRGHAQVTPLHVASTMLSSSAGLLRAACLQSHSHPLQCKALELCFNVALNRLPASTPSGSMLGPSSHHHHHHHHPPSLSNALVAAFKRAQAHQRRGSIESQQQPLLAVKIELEQLIISILDDPSVSRVMREAGFSSTQVKTNVEQAVVSSDATCAAPKEGTTKSRSSDEVRSEDVMSVVESLAGRRGRSVLVVGECSATAEGVVRGVMERVDNGEVPQVLRNLQFITLPLFSFRLMSREEVDRKVGELRVLVKSCCTVGRGVVLYLGDLKWTADYRAGCGVKGRMISCYCPVEHVIMEIRGLLCGGGGRGGDLQTGGGRFWLMGVGSYQTYMRCKIGNPSLEAVWGLQPLAVPAGSLELSLNCDSGSQSQLKSKRIGDEPGWSLGENGARNQLNCCTDCLVKFETEARGLPDVSSSSHGSIASSLPSWLQQYKEESKRAASTIHDPDSIHHLCKKWNSICRSSHKHQHHPSEMNLHFYSASPTSSSVASYNQHHSSLRRWTEHQFWPSEKILHLQDDDVRRSPPNPNSSSSSDTMEMENPNKFKELNAENLKTLCDALERKVPWQSDIIPDIASTVLQVRSGMVRRKERSRLSRTKEETWLFFMGGDADGKEKIARELARLVFGSHTDLVSIGFSAFSSAKSDSTDDLRSKRSRSEGSHSYLERFAEAIGDNPHRVIVMEDVEQVDSYSQMGIKNAMERGRVVRSSGGEEVSIGDAIVILCCESFDSRSRACSPPSKQKSEEEEVKDEEGEKEISSWVCLDLNLSAVDEEMEEYCSVDDVGLMESVDRAFFFKLPDCL